MEKEGELEKEMKKSLSSIKLGRKKDFYVPCFLKFMESNRENISFKRNLSKNDFVVCSLYGFSIPVVGM